VLPDAADGDSVRRAALVLGMEAIGGLDGSRQLVWSLGSLRAASRRARRAITARCVAAHRSPAHRRNWRLVGWRSGARRIRSANASRLQVPRLRRLTFANLP